MQPASLPGMSRGAIMEPKRVNRKACKSHLSAYLTEAYALSLLGHRPPPITRWAVIPHRPHKNVLATVSTAFVSAT